MKEPLSCPIAEKSQTNIKQLAILQLNAGRGGRSDRHVELPIGMTIKAKCQRTKERDNKSLLKVQ